MSASGISAARRSLDFNNKAACMASWMWEMSSLAFTPERYWGQGSTTSTGPRSHEAAVRRKDSQVLTSPYIPERSYLTCMPQLASDTLHTACTQHQAAPASSCGGGGGGRVLSLLARRLSAAPSRSP